MYSNTNTGSSEKTIEVLSSRTVVCCLISHDCQMAKNFNSIFSTYILTSKRIPLLRKKRQGDFLLCS